MDSSTREALVTFADETSDRLSRLREKVGCLDKAGVGDADVINEIFRQVHSMKGAANIVRATPIERLSHKLEDMIVMIRNGELKPDKSIISLMLAVLDRVDDLVDNLDRIRLIDVSREMVKIDEIVKRAR